MRPRVVAFVLLLWLVPLAARAQSGISGAVKDTSGAALPGVQVEASSPVLIERSRTVETDSQGLFSIVDLRPGVYQVTFTLDGFKTLMRPGIELPAGFTATVNATLELGALTETITVQGQAPVVDVRTTVQRAIVPAEIRNAIPLANNAAAFVALIPAATQTASDRDVGGIRGEQAQGFAIHGSRTTDIYLARDGMDYNQYFAGGNRSSSMNPSSIAETTVQTAGMAQAESGGVQINAIPKDGGNIFSGTLQASFGSNRLQWNNISDDLKARGANGTNDIKTLYDVSGGLGGPILVNRLWFFGSARRWLSTSNLPGLYFNATQGSLFYTPDLSRPAYEDNFYIDESIRLTWQVTEKHKIAVMFSNEDNCQCHASIRTGTLAPEATGDNHFSPGPRFQAKWTYPLSSKLLIDAGVSNIWGNVVRRLTGSSPNDFMVTDLNTGLVYGSSARDYSTPPNTGGEIPYGNFNQSMNVTYVTGSTSTAAGFQLREAYQRRDHFINNSMQYQFRGRTPANLVEWISPFHSETNQRVFGAYVQEQWTRRRLTINAGLRFDWFKGSIPAMTLPAGRFLLKAVDFPAVDDGLNFKDINPRIGVAYDLSGDGRTALKGYLGRFVTTITLQDNLLRNQAPVLQMVTSTTRTWNDVNGDYVPQCDLLAPGANGECGPMSNNTFGSTVPGTQYADDVRFGWGRRAYDWQGSVSLTHQLMDGLGMEVGYFRTSYGNFLATDNLLVGPSDYTQYSITTPVNPQLPGGGGQTISTLWDLNPNKVGQVQNLVTSAEHFGKQRDTYDGFEININGRFKNGLSLAGGASMSKSIVDNCFVIDSPAQAYWSFGAQGTSGTGAASPNTYIPCHQSNPWWSATQFRLSGVVPLPKGIRLSGNIQNIQGIPTTASYVYGTAQAQGLGRPISGGTNATRTIDLIPWYTSYTEGRSTQIDLRLARRFRFGRYRIEPQFNIYNVTNAGDVLTMTTRYGTAWQNVTLVLPPRMVKFGFQLDF